MPDNVAYQGAELTKQIQASWEQLLQDIHGATREEQLVTLLAKHVRDPDERRRLARRVRIVFRRSLDRERAGILLTKFYLRLVDAVAAGYDRLSPMVFPALQSASNSQTIQFPTKAIIDELYGKQT